MEIIDFLRYAYLLWSREAKGVIRIDVFSKVAHFLPPDACQEWRSVKTVLSYIKISISR